MRRPLNQHSIAAELVQQSVRLAVLESLQLDRADDDLDPAPPEALDAFRPRINSPVGGRRIAPSA
jgi:hypothetical protein